MKISINGIKADITLEGEKYLSEALSGLEEWISSSGCRIMGIAIDGEKISPGKLPGFFGREIASIGELDISVSSWPELAVEALEVLLDFCDARQEASFEGREEIRANWEKSPACAFINLEINDLAGFVLRSFSGEGLGPKDLRLIVEERLRELRDSKGEVEKSENAVREIAGRMEELPLDIQTGKDGRAAETMQLFSRISEKLFRLLFILKRKGLEEEKLIIGSLPAKAFFGEWSGALKELQSAYETKDTVLVGDLSEYELAPRLLSFYSALKESSLSIA
ncbi:MAG: hypothetical protein LBF78_10190 [Treponema sp.]|jgi:hypothetical protein|nr:hypothetical protein [Treponema sp.]